MGSMGKCTVWPIFDTISFGVCFINTGSCFVISQMIPPLRVSCCSMKEGTPKNILISLSTTVDISTTTTKILKHNVFT